MTKKIIKNKMIAKVKTGKNTFKIMEFNQYQSYPCRDCGTIMHWAGTVPVCAIPESEILQASLFGEMADVKWQSHFLNCPGRDKFSRRNSKK